MKRKISNLEGKIKIGTAQINNSFGNQNYFPYSIGLLQAYAQEHAKNIEEFEFLNPVYKRIPIDNAVKQLSESDIVFFSTYVWNANISHEIAKKLKENKPDITTIFGGCQVPKRNINEFLVNNSAIDFAVYGEGEEVFKLFLENCKEGNFQNIPSLRYINEEGRLIENPLIKRISDLDNIPSPYLSGTFDKLMRENPQENWIGLWETNRGCPFGCAYCEWGVDYQKKLYKHNIQKLSKEIDWFSKNKVEFIFCTDSNFGILDRDIEIVKKAAENKRKFGYPQALSVQNTKNSTERTYEIERVLAESGLSRGVNLAFQSLNEETLKSVGRKNIPLKNFYELQRRFNQDHIETFSDLILGLPNETYKTFTQGVSTLIENGQKNRIQFGNLSILSNSNMGDTEYQKKYGFKIVESRMVNNHGNLDYKGEVDEKQMLVVGTNTMPEEDWIKARTFSWMVSLLYFNKLLQIPFTLINKEYSVGYDKLTESFLKVNPQTNPILYDLSSSFTKKAKDIQKGAIEFCESKDWLNLRWHADELGFIKICAEKGLDNFYREAGQILENCLDQKKIKYNKSMVNESILLNKNIIKLPFQKNDLTLKLSHNIGELYLANLAGKSEMIKEGDYNYSIKRDNEGWDSWNEWCEKVVWYGYKRGNYVYNIKPLNIKNNEGV